MLFEMRSHFAQGIRLLRASLLVLLVLGLMIRPVLTGLSEGHAAEHAMSVDLHEEEHQDDHHDDHAHPHDQVPHADGDAPGNDHASGTHGLMHQPGGHTTLELTAAIEVPPAPRHGQALPNLARPGLPKQPPSNPFRPPIA